jgi:hypothetical protein
MIWAPRSIWKVFQLVRAIFEQFGVGPVTWGGEDHVVFEDQWMVASLCDE